MLCEIGGQIIFPETLFDDFNSLPTLRAIPLDVANLNCYLNLETLPITRPTRFNFALQLIFALFHLSFNIYQRYRRKVRRLNWWKYGENAPKMRKAIAPLSSYFTVPRVSGIE